MSESTTPAADVPEPSPGNRKCKAPEGCERDRIGRLDWCNKHYQRIRRNGDLVRRKTGPKTTKNTMARCTRCNLAFKATRHKVDAQEAGRPVYCSRDCQKAANLVTLPCAACGKDVVRRKADVRGNRVFCDAECRGKASKPKTGIAKPCEHCGHDYYVKKALIKTSRYCSVDCKQDASAVEKVTRSCDHCGTSYTRSASMAGRFCSRQCGYDAKLGTGAGYINADGYRVISQGGGKPAKPEHRLKVEELLGRSLLSTETVHHVNGIRHDNRTDGPLVMDERGRLRSGNLELWSHAHPRGQEVGPKLDYARGLLAMYGTPGERQQYAEHARNFTALPSEEDTEPFPS
ncbi:hypothetical protein [Streptomyces sp. UH6]|uniref:hypothetical protein n=1 Tax=Streptomyces sp. UH6 TaxID=2748379 RepID=UPI0015D51D26|nr:hypothetical protein [Streptomyces sp. UH6]NYV73516.1 hypothetical protein [Streptomyces sp. UH6]